MKIVPSKPAPSDLKNKIDEALVRSAETDAERIQVEVRGDRVILRGTVRSWAEKQRPRAPGTRGLLPGL